jgi:hypothetical protein
MSARVENDPAALGCAPARAFGGRSPAATLIASAVAALVGIGACAAAVLVPAPAAAVAPVVLVSAGGPLLAGHSSRAAIGSWRSRRGERIALRRLRAALDRLPETEHPLGR